MPHTSTGAEPSTEGWCDIDTRPPVVRVSALVVDAGSLLLVRQASRDGTYWLLPGGGLQRGETVAQAVARELLEECDVSAAEIGPPFALIESISPDGGRQRHVLQLVMGVRVWGDPRHARPHDPAVHETGWFTPSVAAGLHLHPPIGDLLAGWVAHLESHPLSDPPPFTTTGVRWAT